MKVAAKPKQEVLAPNAFIGKKVQPADADLAAALGAAKPLWDQLVSALISDCPDLVPEWKFYSLKMGWGFRLQKAKRNIVHFGPCAGSFRVALIFGEKAFQAVRKSAWPKRIQDLIAVAPKYPEGTGIRVEVTAKDIAAIRNLAKIKLEN
ncbi:MAG: DUF3788 family protein [Terracidiphilus sp.]|jgi:hypothetical protein